MSIPTFPANFCRFLRAKLERSPLSLLSVRQLFLWDQIEIWQRLSVNNQLINENEITKQWWIVLGVERNASLTEIKTAYYNKARQYHPDINSSNGAEKMMQIINQAYHQSQVELSYV